MTEIEVDGRRLMLDDHNHAKISRQAGHVFVPQEHSSGMMIAFAPPRHVVDSLHVNDENAEPEHDLHVTASYLGRTSDHDAHQLRDLPEVMDSWAEGQKPFQLTVQGSGTFLSPDGEKPHVLHALVNAPGLHRMQADLVDHLKKYGYHPREDHGFIPHITLGYVRHAVRFLPKVERKSWTANEIWSSIGDERRPHKFGG
jgi:2'-5' RNA ligase